MQSGMHIAMGGFMVWIFASPPSVTFCTPGGRSAQAGGILCTVIH
jgi:hypothetical protein